jgi:ribosomal protein S18 acetylase RimI-like enzyme
MNDSGSDRPAIRPATAADFDFLVDMMVEAANWDGMRGSTRAGVEADPKSWRYLEGWKRPTDFGLIAVVGERPAGLAWARFGAAGDAGYGHVSDSIPELTIAVTSAARGRGVGRSLLTELIDAARNLGLPAVSLSVEDGNVGARSLYESVGFVPVGRNGNADTMLLTLTTPGPVLPSAEPPAGRQTRERPA